MGEGGLGGSNRKNEPIIKLKVLESVENDMSIQFLNFFKFWLYRGEWWGCLGVSGQKMKVVIEFKMV